jgi:hypothetical protein
MEIEKPEIKFSHEYSKLHHQRTARLILVDQINLVNEPESADMELIKYDTLYHEDGKPEHYSLESGFYLLLVFMGDMNIPFTTIRRWTFEKDRFYHACQGRIFNIRRTSNE